MSLLPYRYGGLEPRVFHKGGRLLQLRHDQWRNDHSRRSHADTRWNDLGQRGGGGTGAGPHDGAVFGLDVDAVLHLLQGVV
jgi:hypothetical protein